MKPICSLFSIFLLFCMSQPNAAFAASPPIHCLNCEVHHEENAWSVSVFSRDPLSEHPEVSLLVEKRLPNGRTEHLIFEPNTIAEFQWQNFFGQTFFASGVRIRSLVEEPGIFELSFVGPVTYHSHSKHYSFKGNLTAYYPGFMVNEVDVICEYYLIKNI